MRNYILYIYKLYKCGSFILIFLYSGHSLPLELARRRWRGAWSELPGCSCDHQTSRFLGPAWRESRAASTCESAALRTWRRHNPAHTHILCDLQHFVLLTPLQDVETLYSFKEGINLSIQQVVEAADCYSTCSIWVKKDTTPTKTKNRQMPSISFL